MWKQHERLVRSTNDATKVERVNKFIISQKRYRDDDTKSTAVARIADRIGCQ